MVRWQTSIRRLYFVAQALMLATTLASAAELVDLRPAGQAGDLSRVTIMLQVGGDATIASGGKKNTFPMSVVANIAYDEKLLTGYGSDAAERRSVRYYDQANVAIKVDTGGQKPELREDRRLIGASYRDGHSQLISPSGPLTRDELDLIDVPANSLMLDELLPAKPVAVGSNWSHSEPIVSSLLGLDAASDVEVTSELKEVVDGLARLELVGKLRGAVAGVGTEMEIKAKYSFDLKTKHINWFALLVKEQRSIGHVGPGLDVVAKLILKREPLEASPQLATDIVKQFPSTEGLEMLEYSAATGTFQLHYDRRWYITDEEKNVVILRLVDRGELVAQCNISPVLAVQKQLTLAEYQHEVEQTLDKHFGDFLEASESRSDEGDRIFRVVATGRVSELPIQWVYYLLTSPSGERASLVFTLESDLVEKFASADRPIVAGLHLTKPPVKDARQPATTR